MVGLLRGSVLDKIMPQIGGMDVVLIVYLHHTAMWQALRNIVPLVKWKLYRIYNGSDS